MDLREARISGRGGLQVDPEGQGKVKKGSVSIVRSGKDGQLEFCEDASKGISDAYVVVGLGRGAPRVESRGNPDICHAIKVSWRPFREAVSGSCRNGKEKDPGCDEIDNLDATANKKRAGYESVPIDPASPPLAERIGGIGTRDRPRYILTKDIGKGIGKSCRIPGTIWEKKGGKKNDGKKTSENERSLDERLLQDGFFLPFFACQGRSKTEGETIRSVHPFIPIASFLFFQGPASSVGGQLKRGESGRNPFHADDGGLRGRKQSAIQANPLRNPPISRTGTSGDYRP